MKASYLSAPLASEQDDDSMFIFRLAGPLSTPSQIQLAAGLSKPLNVFEGEGEDGTAKYCVVDATARQSIEMWLSKSQIVFSPTFIRYSKARKNLSPTFAYPTMGVDSTLSHHRLDDRSREPFP